MKITSNKQLKAYWANTLSQEAKVAPRCKHFGECGGCALQDIPYARQLELKQKSLEYIFAGTLDPQDLQDIVASPMEYGYRLRMDYVTSFDPFHAPHNRLGLRKRKHFNFVIDLEECHLIPPELFGKMRQIFNVALEQEMSIYDLVPKKGWLRYFVVRQAGDQVMLSIVSQSEDNSAHFELLASKALELGFTSVYWLVNASDTDVSTGDTVTFCGAEYMNIDLHYEGVQLHIGPHNFFQNNVPGFALILKHIADYIEQLPTRPTTLYDLYAGVGTIGIALARLLDEVIGLELVPENVDMINYNAQRNNVSNYHSFQGDVGLVSQEILNAKTKTKEDNHVAVVDPPRTGLGEQGVAEILNLRPQHLIYISCNPITQAQDLGELLKHYSLVSSQAFDLFPQTLHVENVVILQRR